ncbi:hypothetical protein LINPERHAP1_LOCUS24519 [Linum perenne]
MQIQFGSKRELIFPSSSSTGTEGRKLRRKKGRVYGIEWEGKKSWDLIPSSTTWN